MTEDERARFQAAWDAWWARKEEYAAMVAQAEHDYMMAVLRAIVARWRR